MLVLLALAIVSVVSSSPLTPSDTCLDQSQCPGSETCCLLNSGQYGCCPYSNAVCCSDHEHCCPSGTTCDVQAGTCNNGDITIPFFTKVPAKPKDVNCSGTYYCPDGNTCCLLPSGQWGCCPYPHAACCSDHLHCCPNGYTCSFSTCNDGDITIPFLPKVPAKAKTVVCPDGKSQCPGDETCCLLNSGQYGCCPYSNAVCCSDHEHCCPSGTTCDVQAGTCDQGDITIPFLAKLPANPKSVVCDDGSECPDGDTCCKLASGDWGCCPLPNAACCQDGKHCCPNGYQCDTSAGTCNKGGVTIPFFAKVPAKPKDVPCPDGGSCPDGETCCQLSSGGYGCCPYSNAVCCSDHKHCCPNGYTCDVPDNTCNQGDITIPFLAKVPAKPKDVQCDATHYCPDGNTCCTLSSGEWGCCPISNAVCCSDDKHCCPEGYTCDTKQGTCFKQGDSIIPVFIKPPSLRDDRWL